MNLNNEINIVFNIDEFFKTISEQYNNLTVETGFYMKRDIVFCLNNLDFETLKSHILSYIPGIMIDINYVKKTQIVKYFIRKKEIHFKENKKDDERDFLTYLFFEKKYNDYLVMKDILEKFDDDTEMYHHQAYINHIYNCFEKEIRKFYHIEKTKIQRSQKFKRLINETKINSI